MIPLKDSIPPRTFPFVNYGIIILSTLVFILQLLEPEGRPSLIERYGMIPARITSPGRPIEIPDQAVVRTPYGVRTVQVTREAASAAVPALLTLLTCVFLHGGWLHFLGNIWFLHIFGDNVEDRLGHGLYLFFYLFTGVMASAVHLLTNWASMIPTIGASGAIAGVMGAYMLLYPRATVVAVVPIVFFLQIMVLPAPIFLGIWFAIQFFQGAFSIVSVQSTGVAWWAHVGGFVAGFIVALGFKKGNIVSPPVTTRRPDTEPYRHYRRGW